MYQSVIRDPGGTQSIRLITQAVIVNGSLLLVPADTVAFFVCNGHVSEPYYSGRWEINTGVSPFFVHFRNLMTQGDPGITCQVWYINICQENCKSGGTGELIFQEQRFRISMKAKASYAIRYVISNPRELLKKLVGMHHSEFDDDDIQPAIDAIILPYIKQAIIAYISHHTIHDFQSNLVSVGSEIQLLLRSELQQYGLNLKAVSITGVNIPDEEFKRLTELEKKYASGTVATDIEVDNIKRVYGDVEQRTLTEMMTGTLRGQGTPLRRETSGLAGMMATLPIQMSVANQMMNHMSDSLNSLAGRNSGGQSENQGVRGYSDTQQAMPPDLPRMSKRCPNCGKELDDADMYCRFCGRKL